MGQDIRRFEEQSLTNEELYNMKYKIGQTPLEKMPISRDPKLDFN